MIAQDLQMDLPRLPNLIPDNNVWTPIFHKGGLAAGAKPFKFERSFEEIKQSQKSEKKTKTMQNENFGRPLLARPHLPFCNRCAVGEVLLEKCYSNNLRR